MSDTVEVPGSVDAQEVPSTASMVESLLDRDVQARLAAELVEQARTQGVDLVGPGGLLAGLTKQVPGAEQFHHQDRRAAHRDVVADHDIGYPGGDLWTAPAPGRSPRQGTERFSTSRAAAGGVGVAMPGTW